MVLINIVEPPAVILRRNLAAMLKFAKITNPEATMMAIIFMTAAVDQAAVQVVEMMVLAPVLNQETIALLRQQLTAIKRIVF
jgi:hypothetical protein